MGDRGTPRLTAVEVATILARHGFARNQFVAINCAAIPATLIESELFGHERGAFTGAFAPRAGRFQLADRGTLFLDEIGDLPPELQPKLLRVLQEQRFERLGGNRTIQVNVRVVAATNQDLWSMVQERRFRADLYYRLNVFPITLPPLRERREDIPPLADHFVQKFAQRLGKPIPQIPDDVMEALMNYHWPGNIRELQNFIERAVIITTGVPGSLSLLRNPPPPPRALSRMPSAITSSRRSATRMGLSAAKAAPPPGWACRGHP